MQSSHNRAVRMFVCSLTFGLACIAGRAPAQTPDKFGPVMLSANVLEEASETNRIQILWNEHLMLSSLSLPDFRVVLAASNLTAAISFAEYDSGNPPTTTLRMGPANWFYRSNYYVVVNSIRDLAGNVVAPNSVIGVTWPGRPTSPVPPSATPRLTLTRSGANVVRVSWPTNAYSYALDWTTNVTRTGSNSVAGPWCEVQPLMANPYFTSPAPGSRMIFRLRRTQ